MLRSVHNPTIPYSCKSWSITSIKFFLLFINIQFSHTYATDQNAEIQGCQLFTIEPERLKYQNLYYQNSVKQDEHTFQYQHNQYIDKNDIISTTTRENIDNETFQKIKSNQYWYTLAIFFKDESFSKHDFGTLFASNQVKFSEERLFYTGENPLQSDANRRILSVSSQRDYDIDKIELNYSLEDMLTLSFFSSKILNSGSIDSLKLFVYDIDANEECQTKYQTKIDLSGFKLEHSLTDLKELDDGIEGILSLNLYVGNQIKENMKVKSSVITSNKVIQEVCRGMGYNEGQKVIREWGKITGPFFNLGREWCSDIISKYLSKNLKEGDFKRKDGRSWVDICNKQYSNEKSVLQIKCTGSLSSNAMITDQNDNYNQNCMEGYSAHDGFFCSPNICKCPFGTPVESNYNHLTEFCGLASEPYEDDEDADIEHRRVKRMTGGRSLANDKIPFTVELFKTLEQGESHCLATIINPTWVITAAHCVYDVGVKRNEMFVSSEKLPGTPYVHTNYTSSMADNIMVRQFDIALINIKTKNFDNHHAIHFDNFKRPICLPTATLESYSELTLIGVNEDHERTAAEYYESCPDDISIPEGLLCLKSSSIDISTQHGDSGGPLLHKSIDLVNKAKCDTDSKSIQKWHLAGITSGGNTERPEITYAVNVLYHQQWINDEINRNNIEGHFCAAHNTISCSACDEDHVKRGDRCVSKNGIEKLEEMCLFNQCSDKCLPYIAVSDGHIEFKQCSCKNGAPAARCTEQGEEKCDSNGCNKNFKFDDVSKTCFKPINDLHTHASDLVVCENDMNLKSDNSYCEKIIDENFFRSCGNDIKRLQRYNSCRDALCDNVQDSDWEDIGCKFLKLFRQDCLDENDKWRSDYGICSLDRPCGKKNHHRDENDVCVPNKCLCPNGLAVEDEECTQDGANQCKVCNWLGCQSCSNLYHLDKYHISNDRFNFDEGIEYCKSQNMIIARILTKDDHMLMESVLESPSIASNANIWIGSKKIYTPDKSHGDSFYWYNDDRGFEINSLLNVRNNFQHFAKGQPNNYKGWNENCLQIRGSLDFQWNDSTCNARFQVACEKTAECKPNVCTCKNGQPVSPSMCSQHNENNCQSCSEHYHLDGKHCVQNDENCKEINSEGCQVCNPGYYLTKVGSDMICTECKQGSGFSSLLRCKAEFITAVFDGPTLNTYIPGYAIDGKLANGYKTGLAHSKDKNAKLIIDLKPCIVRKVIVYPRSDCCQYRFLDLEIYLDKEKTIQCHPIFDWSNDEKYIKKRTKTGLVYDCFSDRITETIIATNKDHTLNIVEVEAECTNLPENFYLHHSNDYPGAVTLASRISGNNIIDRVSLKTNWELSFGIYLLGKQSGWRNIIHISTKYDHDRQPAVWFHNNSYKLHIVHSKGCSSYNHNDRIVVNVDYGWKTGQFHKFKFIAVQHETDAKASRVSLYIDDVLKESWIRSDTCVGREANVFVSKSTNSANVALVDYNYK